MLNIDIFFFFFHVLGHSNFSFQKVFNKVKFIFFLKKTISLFPPLSYIVEHGCRTFNLKKKTGLAAIFF